MKQFATEALVLTVGGGLLGIAVGVGLSAGLDNRTRAGQEITTRIQPWSVVVALGVTVPIGFISGRYPAYRATAGDLITALRNDSRDGPRRTAGRARTGEGACRADDS